jgi:hypothetical protein
MRRSSAAMTRKRPYSRAALMASLGCSAVVAFMMWASAVGGGRAVAAAAPLTLLYLLGVIFTIVFSARAAMDHERPLGVVGVALVLALWPVVALVVGVAIELSRRR